MNRSHLVRAFQALLLLAFLLVSIYYIYNYHVWPLSRDQWHMYAPYFEQGLWRTLLTPMSTHRHIFPFFFFDTDMRFFHGLNHWLAACGAFFDALIISLLIFSLMREPTLGGDEKWALGIFLVTLLSWLINIAQLGWGFMSTQYYLTILASLLSVYCLYQYRSEGKCYLIGICVACGVIATFSFGMGILVWPALFYFAWVWNVKFKTTFLISTIFVVSLLLFLWLPGGDSIEQSISINWGETIRFTSQLAAGPIYYLLKSFRVIDAGSIKEFAIFIGVAASLCGVILLTRTLIFRPQLSLFSVFCHTLIMLGLGTATLISVTRSQIFLDIWVDRYQIWAVLLWAGLIPLLYLQTNGLNSIPKKLLLVVLACFPLLAFPSQLDMGSRLYEYKTRVREALLVYQVGIADKAAAQEALHWNWEHKLPFFFAVMSHLEKTGKNIYYQGPYHLLGKPVDLKMLAKLAPMDVRVESIIPISSTQLLDQREYAIPRSYVSQSGGLAGKNVAFEIRGVITMSNAWKYAISINEQGIVNGVAIRIQHSMLPRPTRNFEYRDYNFFGVVRDDGSQKIRWCLLTDQDPEQPGWISESWPLVQASSRK